MTGFVLATGPDLIRTPRERSSSMRFRACAVYLLGNLNRTVLYTGVTNAAKSHTSAQQPVALGDSSGAPVP